MGDMAEYYDEQYRDVDAQPRPTCWYCNMPDLVWRRTYGRWTLWENDGAKLHQCRKLIKKMEKKMSASQPFWILWNPEGTNPPTKKFYTYDEAAEVAESMQRRIGLGTMHILKVEQSFTVTQTAKWIGYPAKGRK